MWSFACVAVCLVLHLVGAAPKGLTLPKEFKTCTRGDDACVQEAIMSLLPTLVKGVPSLGVLPMDPLRLTEVVIDQGTGPVSIKLTLSDMDIFGIGQAHFTNVRSKLDDQSYLLTMDVRAPTLAMSGDYEIAGKILVLPIQGKGRSNFTFSDIFVKVTIKGHVTKRDGEDFVDIDDFIFMLDLSGVRFKFDNLFNGDQALGDNMNKFLNDNWRVVVDELKPSFEDTFGQVFKEITKRIYSKVPYPEIHLKE